MLLANHMLLLFLTVVVVDSAYIVPVCLCFVVVSVVYAGAVISY